MVKILLITMMTSLVVNTANAIEINLKEEIKM